MNHSVKSGTGIKQTINRTNTATDRKASALWGGLSFVLPAAAMLTVLAVNRITPFGNFTLITGGGFAWFERFCRMHEAIVEGRDVFYRFGMGFGSGFYPDFASGLCTPFTTVSLLFRPENLASAYSVITVLRAGFAGLFAWLALNRIAGGCGKSFLTAMACAYALCGFTACAAWYPSIADAAVFFPLLVMGVYRYVNESRCLQLFLFGAAFFITCPRLFLSGAVMAMLMYFVFYFRRENRRLRVYKFAVFAAVLVCTVAAAAFLLLPMGASFYGNGLFRLENAGDSLASLCFGGIGASAEGGRGSLTAAALPLIGTIAFWFNRKIGVGEKLCAGGVIVLSAAACCVRPLGVMLFGYCGSGGEAANIGFMLPFAAAYCTARAMSLPDGLRLWQSGASAGIYAALAAASMAFYAGDTFALMAELGLAAVSAAIFIQICLDRELPSLKMSCAATAAMLLFGALNCGAAVGAIHSEYSADALRAESLGKTAIAEQLNRLEKETGSAMRFFRLKSDDANSCDAVDLNENHISGFGAFAESLGIKPNGQSGGGENFTPLTDILFAVGYEKKGETVRPVGTIQSPAFSVNMTAEESAGFVPSGNDAFEVQNDLAERWLGNTELFRVTRAERVSSIVSSESERYKWIFGNDETVVDKYEFRIGEGDRLFVLAEGEYSFAVEDDSRSAWQSGVSGGVYELTPQEGGGRAVVYLSYASGSAGIKPTFAVMSAEGLEALNEQAGQRGAEYISQRGNTVKFMLQGEKGQLAVTSIPYERGWRITLNGKKSEARQVCGGLVGIELQDGSNSVVMKYRPPLFGVGAVASVIALVLGMYLSVYTEHEISRRRKVRMAFRAVELDLSRRSAAEREQIRQTATAKQSEHAVSSRSAALSEKSPDKAPEPMKTESANPMENGQDDSIELNQLSEDDELLFPGDC